MSWFQEFPTRATNPFMKKEYINPDNFSKILGSYSHGIKVDIGNAEMIFVSGQLAMDDEGNSIAPNDFTKQTEIVFENIKKILEEGDSSINDVVKAIIYITDMSRYSEVSAVRNKYFEESKPISTLVEISKTAKEGCDVEIEVVAIKQK